MLCFTTFKIKIVNVTRTSLLFIPTWSYIRIWAWGKQKWRKLCACKLWLQLLQITIKFIPFTINLPFLVVPISSSSILRICSWADMFSLVATNCHKIYRQNLNEKISTQQRGVMFVVWRHGKLPRFQISIHDVRRIIKGTPCPRKNNWIIMFNL